MRDTPRCQKCGILPHKHQRIGGTWAYLEKKVLLADQVGTGKTTCAAILLALMIEAGDLDNPSRKVLIIVNPAALRQWKRALTRMLPDLKVMIPPKIKSKRIEATISGDWQVCLVGYQTFNNDLELFRTFRPYAIICDDVEPLSNNKTKTHYSLAQICMNAERVLCMNATPLAKRLFQIYNTLLIIGGRELLGGPTSFEKEYIKYSFSKKAVIARAGGSRYL